MADTLLVLAVALGFACAATNGLHDASNAIATLVATRAARPGQALALAAVFNLLGPLLVGAAVASAIGAIVTLGGSEAAEVLGPRAARRRRLEPHHVARALPSSSGHAHRRPRRRGARRGRHGAGRCRRALRARVDIYRAAMAGLADVEDLRAVMGRQELYRRCSRMGESAVDVAQRLIYAVLKES